MSIDDDDDRIIQIIPAVGWSGVWKQDDGSLFSAPLVAFGLRRNGTMCAIDHDGDTGFDEIGGDGNFVCMLGPGEEIDDSVRERAKAVK